MKRFGLFLLAVMLLMACTDKKGEFVRPNDRSAFVTLTDAVPDAILEIRYFSTYNFVGTRIDGYEEPTALLTKQAADSLQVVSKEVMKMGYRLKIYDAYRPQKAVDHFVRWSKDANDSLMKRYFYPQLTPRRNSTWVAPSTGSALRVIRTLVAIPIPLNIPPTTALPKSSSNTVCCYAR